ncbi:MAG: hypothetical protein EA381_17215 [Planctomycetaceae bacterium]|nr:MAG: hypothetical protein EA381_17215 [Planctomycetaceae bacterium]
MLSLTCRVFGSLLVLFVCLAWDASAVRGQLAETGPMIPSGFTNGGGLLAQAGEPIGGQSAGDGSLGERLDGTRAGEFVESLLPRVEGGTPISGKGMAYAVTVAGFIVAFIVALLAIRMLASLSIVVAFVGSLTLLCLMIYNDSVQTWRQLAVSTAVLAIANAAYAAIAILFGGKRSN